MMGEPSLIEWFGNVELPRLVRQAVVAHNAKVSERLRLMAILKRIESSWDPGECDG